MGTNYYLTKDYCHECGRSERVHIGKRSVGWMFSFHATDTIKSWADWKLELSRSESVYPVQNEYGDRMRAESFIEIVEKSRGDKLNHFDECMRTEPGWPRRAEIGSEYKDAEGWSFSTGEFS